MQLSLTGKLENISLYEDKEKNVNYHSLVFTKNVWSNKLNRDTEEVVSVSIPQKLNWTVPEFKKVVGKTISFNVTNCPVSKISSILLPALSPIPLIEKMEFRSISASGVGNLSMLKAAAA